MNNKKKKIKGNLVIGEQQEIIVRMGGPGAIVRFYEP